MKVLEIINKNKTGCKYGVPYLDHKMSGITKGDLILIGARTGAGKSTIALNIAKHNASLGKRVVLYSLEDFKNDILVKETYYKFLKITGSTMIKPSQFFNGDFDVDSNKEAILKAEKLAEKELAGIEIVNRNDKFTKSDLEKSIKEKLQKQDIDLIILDHIDYMDKENEDISDLTHISDLMREIRRLQYIHEIPVVIISHLRKPPSQKDKVIIPSLDEFIGSSNKVKESTVVIMLAPDEEYNLAFPYSHIKSTWCVVRKHRINGVDNTAAKVMFNTRTGKYEKEFKEYKINYAGTEVNRIGEK